MGELFSANPDRLEAAIVGFGNEVRIATPEPVHEAGPLDRAPGEIKRSGGEQADIFAAAQQAIEKFLAYRDRDYEVIFVVVGVSSNENQSLADKAIAALRRKAVSVFGIGPAVPFGHPNFGRSARTNALASSETKRGPVESLFPERIQLEIADHQGTQDLDDSGYGPFSLERLCRQTGGKFFRLHDTNPTGWEVDPRTGDIKSELLREYRPDYISVEQYQRLLAENKCRLASATPRCCRRRLGWRRRPQVLTREKTRRRSPRV